jgi:hypothetical protein
LNLFDAMPIAARFRIQAWLPSTVFPRSPQHFFDLRTDNVESPRRYMAIPEHPLIFHPEKAARFYRFSATKAPNIRPASTVYSRLQVPVFT